ncbi:MAG: glycerol-3-phosphate dehydrogenase/oxidase [Caldimonas sp.]
MSERSVELLVIGGGICGAGIALEAARRGVDVMLVEARDFAWGTSSRSSKLVHGGLRYLREGAFALTRESVHERGQLLRDAPGLVEAQRAYFGYYAGRPPGRATMAVGLAIYDWFGTGRTRAFHSPAEALQLAPHTASEGLLGGSSYLDAKTDDARLVMRVLREAVRHGARVVNQAAVLSFLRAGDGSGAETAAAGDVIGARIAGAGYSGVVRARCVINATGAWADTLRAQLGAAPKLRPLRGSHLLFPLWRLPVAQSVSLLHPADRRPVFAMPWEGAALVGTTDLDHRGGLDDEPVITADEVRYLLEALHDAFPSLQLTAADAISSYAGVRPVVDDGAGAPSSASREHVVSDEHGLISVSGGKLTTFRVIALDVLRHASTRLPALARAGALRAGSAPIFAPVAESVALARLPLGLRQRLIGRYGDEADPLVAGASSDDLHAVPGTATLWAELHWALRHEQVHHLDDLLLRRSRLGLLLTDRARSLLPRLQRPACEALGWSAAQWQDECARYAGIIADHYSVPAP